MSEAEKPVKRQIPMLYMGIERGKSVKRIHRYYPLEGEEWENNGLPFDDPSRPAYSRTNEHVYGGKGKRRHNNVVSCASPGGIFLFEVDDQFSVYGTPQYIERWKNDEDVAKWQTRSRMVDLAIEMKDKAVKDSKQRLDLEVLDPIGRAYYKANTRDEQTVLLAEVIRYITQWSERNSR